MGFISKTRFLKIYINIKNLIFGIFDIEVKVNKPDELVLKETNEEGSTQKINVEPIREKKAISDVVTNPLKDTGSIEYPDKKEDSKTTIFSSELESFRYNITNRDLSDPKLNISYYQNFKNKVIQKYSELEQFITKQERKKNSIKNLDHNISKKSLHQILKDNSLYSFSKQRIKQEENEKLIKKEFNKDLGLINNYLSKEEFEKARKIHLLLSQKIIKADSKLKKQFQKILPKIDEAQKNFYKKEQEKKLKEELERKRLEEERLKAAKAAEENLLKEEEKRKLEEKAKILSRKAYQDRINASRDLFLEKKRTEEEKRKEEEKILKQLEEEVQRKKEEDLRLKKIQDQQKINPGISISTREKVNEDARRIRESIDAFNIGIQTNTNYLNSLLKRKENWVDFESALDKNDIKYLYHFTDKKNINSIIKNGGLYSWYYCDKNKIDIPSPGGSVSSRKNDTINNKTDFVRLAFNKNHPMLYIAKKDGRIEKECWLKINREVVYFENTEFSDKNAAAFKSYKPNIGKDLRYLTNIRFDILRKGVTIPHYKLSADEKPFNQAEILVKSWIPLRYIENIDDYQ